MHDAEGRVVGHQPGSSRHQGSLGAVLVEFADVTFAVDSGFTDAQRESPPLKLVAQPMAGVNGYPTMTLSQARVFRSRFQYCIRIATC